MRIKETKKAMVTELKMTSSQIRKITNTSLGNFNDIIRLSYIKPRWPSMGQGSAGFFDFHNLMEFGIYNWFKDRGIKRGYFSQYFDFIREICSDKKINPNDNPMSVKYGTISTNMNRISRLSILEDDIGKRSVFIEQFIDLDISKCSLLGDTCFDINPQGEVSRRKLSTQKQYSNMAVEELNFEFCTFLTLDRLQRELKERLALSIL